MATKARIKKQQTAEVLAQRRVISVGEARKVIGQDAAALSDEQVGTLVLALEDIALSLLSSVSK